MDAMDGALGGPREEDADAALLRGGIASLTAGFDVDDPALRGNEASAASSAGAGSVVLDGGLDGGLFDAWDGEDGEVGPRAFESWESTSGEAGEGDDACNSDPDEAESYGFAGEEDEDEADSDDDDIDDDEADSEEDDDTPRAPPLPSLCPCEPRWHELYLPPDTSPSFQPLKYPRRRQDEGSDDECDDAARCRAHRTHMIGSGRGRPPAACMSSDSESSDSDDDEHKTPSRSRHAPTVSFGESVTVYPVFDTGSYPPSVVEAMHTGLRELRANKLRNRREFAYDDNDWRNATEDEGMEPDDRGDLVHPVHRADRSQSIEPPSKPQHEPRQDQQCANGSVVRTYSSSLGGYCVGGTAGRKRMRLFCP